MDDRLVEIKRELNWATKGCREDMHEPDEQDVFATIINPKGNMDNAFGNDITGGEIIVQISRYEVTGEDAVRSIQKNFNLADLIALARKGESE